ncbi:MAG: T9SS type A sorting domain-containing protein [Paludibacter sp.]|nr:T9SS type A sorting domain-containing protein [Paludibacter sp.]
MKKLFLTFSFVFYAVSLMLAQPQTKDWVFSTPEWIAKKSFYAPGYIDSLGVLAGPKTPVHVIAASKTYVSPTMTYTFTHALRLTDGAKPDTIGQTPLPISMAVAFEMNGPGQIRVMCLSTTQQPRPVIISNGVQMLHSFMAMPNNYVDSTGNQLPVEIYYYNGGHSPIMIYSMGGGLDLFYIGADKPGITIPNDTVTFNVKVPQGTQQCWIAGSFNNWNNASHQMQKIADNQFTMTLYGVNKNGLEYKYLSGPGNWDYVEKGALGEEVPNRTYQGNDTVFNWAAVYDTTSLINKEITFEAVVPFAVNKLFVVGQFNQWQMPDYMNEMYFVSMLPDGKLFRKTITVKDKRILDNFRYKFAAGAGWEYAQTQDEDFSLHDTNMTVIRHNIFGFYNYETSNSHPKDWNIGKMAGDTAWIKVNEYVDPEGLLIMASEEAPMIADKDEKYNDQLHFTHRLKTEGPAVFSPENNHLPIARALAFNIGPNTQIAVAALTDSVQGMVFISDGTKVLSSIPVPGINTTQNGQIPMSVFNYQGDSTAVYLYSEYGGVNFYYVGTSNYTGSPYEEPKQTYTVKVPQGTNQVLMAGDFNNWDPAGYWMERVDSVTFQATIWGADAQTEYKYLNGPNWTFVEVDANGNDVANRKWTPVDTVQRWMNMFMPEMTKIYYDDIVTSYGENITVTIKSATTTNQMGGGTGTAISYEFELSYDPNILQYTGYETAGTLSAQGNIVVNATTSWNKIYVSYMTTQPFPTIGDLLKLNFKVLHNSGYSHTQCWINEFYYDNRHIWDTRSGDISIQSFMPGDVDGNYDVQAYDAALTLQYSVGMDPLPMFDPLPWESWRVNAANVDGIEGITANDASLILQYSAYLIGSFGPQPGDSSVTMRVPAQKSAYVTIIREKDQLIFKSFGKLVGFNLFINEELDAFGTPVIADNINMSAVNIKENIYAVGLAATSAPAEGSTIMTIPLLRDIPEKFAFNLIVNADKISMISEAQTGIVSIEEAGIKLYPNPVVDLIHLNNLTVGSRISISDISGRMVLNQQVGTTEEKIDMSALANGIYTLSILNETTHAVTKFIKK